MNAHDGDGDSIQAVAAHQEYLEEAKGLVDEQVDALFGRVVAAAERGATTPHGGQRQGQAAVARRDGYTLTLSNGARSATFTVEAITDLPEDADRAQAFPAGQARCMVRMPDDTTAEWTLHRAGAGNAAPSYEWMPAKTETGLTDEQIALTLGPLFQ